MNRKGRHHVRVLWASFDLFLFNFFLQEDSDSPTHCNVSTINGFLAVTISTISISSPSYKFLLQLLPFQICVPVPFNNSIWSQQNRVYDQWRKRPVLSPFCFYSSRSFQVNSPQICSNSATFSNKSLNNFCFRFFSRPWYAGSKCTGEIIVIFKLGLTETIIITILWKLNSNCSCFCAMNNFAENVVHSEAFVWSSDAVG